MIQSYSDEAALIPLLTFNSPDNDSASRHDGPIRPHSQSSLVTSPESYLPDFDFSLRGQRRQRPRSIDARRAVSSTLDGLNRLSSMISPTVSSRPSSPTFLNASPTTLFKRKSKPEMADKRKGKAAIKDENPKDPLPTTKSGLEIRLNYHLSELDRLKRQVKTCNAMIEEDFNRLHDIQTRLEAREGKMDDAIRMLIEGFETSVRNRDRWGRFVDYHRAEIERIGVRNLEIRRMAGEESPASVVGQIGTNDGEWVRLFGVGRDGQRGFTSPG